MPDVAVRRLTLRIWGMPTDEAADIGRRVAAGLGRVAWARAAPIGVDRVNVQVPSGGPADRHDLADRIAAEIVREVGRVL